MQILYSELLDFANESHKKQSQLRSDVSSGLDLTQDINDLRS